MRRKILIPILLLYAFILTSCLDNSRNKVFLPDYCQTYNQFINTVSDDFYKILVENGYKIESNKFGDSIVEVKSLIINEDDPLYEIDLNGIQCFPYINKLELTGKSIKDISPLINLERVETLTIDNTKIFKLEPLKNMTKLKSLTINNTNTLQRLDGIENFKRLSEINLVNNGLIEVEELADLENLETININKNEVETIDALSNLPKLKTLSVENNKISFNNVNEIDGFDALENLFAATNNICKTEALGTLEKLKILDISNNNLTNMNAEASCMSTVADFTFIENISGLETFFAKDNGIDSLATITSDLDLGNLKILDLSNNLISNISPLINNTSLHDNVFETLILKDNLIAELPVINNDTLPTIKTLDLSNNKLTKITNFQKHDSLVNLNLAENEITEIIDSFIEMDNLTQVSWYKNIDEDEKKNIISRIENSFIDTPQILFNLNEDINVLSFDFLTTNTDIINSFKGLNQFTEVNLNDCGINSIDINSFNLLNVTKVEVNDNQLTDILWINNLPNLTNFSATNNLISNIEEEIINPTKINTLDLSGNLIDNVAFLSVANFPKLKNLSLANNNIISINELFKLSTIENVDLSNNFITTLPALTQTTLPSIKVLNLANNNLTKIIDFKDNDSLSDLILHNNEITEIVNSFSEMDNLSRITWFDYENEKYNDINRIENSFINTPKLLFYLNEDINVLSFDFLTINTDIINSFKGLNQFTEVNLNDYGINSIDINSFNLLNVTKVEVNNNQLTDILWINNLPKLGSFSADNNLINISITDINSNLIKNLSLVGNQINNVEFLSKMPKIEILDLGFNNVVLDNFNLLSNFVNLKEIYLNDNNISSVNGINNLDNLEILNLESNNITFINGITNLQNLTNLYLTTTSINYINGLSSLGSADLDLYSITANAVDITADSLKDNNFQTVNLSYKIINNFDFLENLTYIKELDLSYTDITNLTYVSGLNRLEILYINKNYDNNKIQDIASLENLTSLKILSLNNNNISDIKPLINLVNLEELNLINNNIISIKLNELSNNSVFDNMSSLTYLNLAENEFTELVGLNNMESLKVLDIPGTVVKFTDTLSGNNELISITNYYYGVYNIDKMSVIVENSFNSKLFTQISFLNGYSNDLNGSFKYLESLNLSNTGFTNIDFISEMNDLIILNFGNNTTITTIDNLSCSNLSNLESISLSDNVTDITNSFNACVSLYNVNLGSNINNIDSSFKSSKLVNLYFPYNYSKSITINDSFTYVETLDVSNTSIDNYHFIDDLTSLKVLNMNNIITSDRKFANFPVDISKLTNLERISISGSVYDNLEIEAISSLFNNSKLNYINFGYITISSISNSFKNNTDLSEINLSDTFISSISGSFINNSIVSMMINGNGGNMQITDSFDDNSNLNWVEFDNYDKLYITNSFNDTPLYNLHFSVNDGVMELSGFNNTQLSELESYENIESISGFENVEFQTIHLASNKLTDFSFMDNIDKNNLQTLYLENLTLDSADIFSMFNNCSQLRYLYISNSLTNLNSIELNIINKLSYISMVHNNLDKEEVISKLAQKTTSNLLQINIPVITENDFYQHFENDSDLVNRQLIRQELIDLEEQSYRNQLIYDNPDLTISEIDSLVEAHMLEYVEEVNGLVEAEVNSIIDNAMSKFIIY